MRGTGAGLALAVLSAASFGTSGTFARSLLDAGWSPGAAVTARVGLAALVLAVPAVLALRGRWSVLRRTARPVVLFGLLGVAGAQLFYFSAVQRLSVGVALLLEYLGIVLVVAWMWAARGHRPRRLVVVGSLVAVVGLVGVLDVLGGVRLDPLGVLFGLLAAVGLAGYFVLSGESDDDLPPVAMASAGMGVGAVVLAAFGAVGVLPMTWALTDVQFAGRTTSWLVPLLGISIVAAVLAYTTGIVAARRLGPRLASFVGLLEVLCAVLFAWLLLDELPTSGQLVGGALIIAGVALVRLDELLPSRRPAVVEGAVEPAAEPVRT